MLPGFSISHKTKTGWSFPEEINIKGIKKEHKLSGCFLSNDQEILLVAGEQRKDNFGERDLYVSFIKPDNTWTKPINLGEVINTKGNESAPFLSEDNSTLFYASDGLNGYGESDIYMTHRLDDTWKHWSQPENLGPIINTESNQSFFSISNGKMYFSSEYEKGEGLDILTLNAPHNEPSNNTNNTEQIIVSESKDLSVSSDLPVISADLNKSLSLIYFDFNRTDLKKATFYELERIAKALNQYPALQIEIDGHTDAVGSEKYNYELAQKRINTVLYYFIKQSNIDSKRILVKNYGETLPLESNLTEEGRKLNRRVEISFKTTLIVKN
jgi:outer membrane protein OmpA-like peptidoglycan-associated protein